MTPLSDAETPEAVPDELRERLTEALARVEDAGQRLAVSPEVSDEVREAVRAFVELVPETSEPFAGADPYLVESLYAGTVECLKTLLWLGDDVKQRSQLRIPLERVRQALRDLLAEWHVALEQPPKSLAAWLIEQTGVPQAELAELLGVSPRTLQRWASPSDATEPSGDDLTRLRVVARVVDQLRWSMTPTGVVRWLRRAHPSLGDERRPADLLDEPDAYTSLVRLAASTRAMVAT